MPDDRLKFGQKIEGLGRLPLARLEADELPRRQRGQLIQLPAERLIVVRPGERLGQGIELRKAFGLVEIARPGDEPHAERRRSRVVPQLLQQHADDGMVDRHVDQRQLVVGRSRGPRATIPCRW